MKRNRKRWILLGSALVLLAVLGYSLFQLYEAKREYDLQEAAYEPLLIYKPDSRQPDAVPVGSAPSGSGTAEPVSPSEEETVPETVFVNESILQLQADHPNALGWISVPGTAVEYPFVQGADNDYFLHRDVDGNYLYAGVPFLDYRCAPDFSGPNSVIYGHNMKNGSMFNTLGNFRTRSFFDENREIIVYLPDQTIYAEIVACLVADPNKQDYLYDIEPGDSHLSRMLSEARCAMEAREEPAQRFITLSTCGYEFEGARIVIVGIIRD